jgi:hypothetical protein
MKQLWYKVKKSAYGAVFLFVMALGVFWFIYNIIRPTKDKNDFLESVQTKVATAIKENEIRATLEKDKIGAVKNIYDRKLKETKEIQDREERLKALIRLHEELDL